MENDFYFIDAGPNVTIYARFAVVLKLTAGFTYIPIVKAVNDYGSTTVECPPAIHSLGK